MAATTLVAVEASVARLDPDLMLRCKTTLLQTSKMNTAIDRLGLFQLPDTITYVTTTLPNVIVHRLIPLDQLDALRPGTSATASVPALSVTHISCDSNCHNALDSDKHICKLSEVTVRATDSTPSNRTALGAAESAKSPPKNTLLLSRSILQHSNRLFRSTV